MQRLEVSGAVRLIYRSLGVKRLNDSRQYSNHCYSNYYYYYFLRHVSIVNTLAPDFFLNFRTPCI